MSLQPLPVIASSTPTARKLLQQIDGALDTYDMAGYRRWSRQFLSRFPQHAQAHRVRYELALQLIADNITKPHTAEAEEARTLLRAHQSRAPEIGQRFDAALLLLKFETKGDYRDRAEDVLERFVKQPDRDQVYFWVIAEAVQRGEVATAARFAERLLAEYPRVEGAAEYRAIIQRAALTGRRAPFTADEQRRFGLNGRVVLLDFWASWCGPCVAALPELKAFHATQSHTDLVILGVSIDDEPGSFQTFLKTHRPPWPQLRSPNLAQRFGIIDVPRYAVIDREGRVVSTELRGPALFEEVRQRLKGSKSPARAGSK